MNHYDIIIIGAGFSGLAACLTLAQQKKRVLLLEKLIYPGGCAGTFQKKGFFFEAGATLCAGLNEDEIFGQWHLKYQLPLELEDLNPALIFYSPQTQYHIPKNKNEWVAHLCQLAPNQKLKDQLLQFFEYQSLISQELWQILKDPHALPSFHLLPTILKYIPKTPILVKLIQNLGLSLNDVLKRFDLDGFMPLMDYLKGLCQITLQCQPDQADANFALAIMDYYFRGTKHIKGGIGALANAIVKAIQDEGGEVLLGHAVTQIELKNQQWIINSRSQQYSCQQVIANLLPQHVANLTKIPLKKRFEVKENQIQSAWSACLWYLVFEFEDCPKSKHIEMIADTNAPYIEGNHIFCSFGHIQQKNHKYYQSVTISTHILASKYANTDQKAELIDHVQKTMLHTFDLYSEIKSKDAIIKYSASPRTIERFTGRKNGAVGGIPRHKGMAPYLDLFKSQEYHKNFYLIGDSFFPGQSTLACALGGIRVAHHLL